MADHSLDTQGLNCPLPVLKTKKALLGVQPGETLEILATDPGAERDIPAFCETSGHELVSQDCESDVLRFVIRKKP